LPEAWPESTFDTLQSVQVLHLKCSLGAQRAIALGLYQIHEFTDAGAVVIMQSNGEDRAEDLPALLTEFDYGVRKELVFARHSDRPKSLTARISRGLYRLIHSVLTGTEAQMDTFSVVPRFAVNRLMASPELWNHYASAVHRARLPRRLVPVATGKPLSGESQTSLGNLLSQAMTAISVFGDQVSLRLLSVSAAFGGFALSIVVLTGLIHIFTPFMVPAWATYMMGSLLGLVLQALTFTILFAFIVATRRSGVDFILQRDAPFFLLGKTDIPISPPLVQLGRALMLKSTMPAVHERE
jgi:hypothetical protein